MAMTQAQRRAYNQQAPRRTATAGPSYAGGAITGQTGSTNPNYPGVTFYVVSGGGAIGSIGGALAAGGSAARGNVGGAFELGYNAGWMMGNTGGYAPPGIQQFQGGQGWGTSVGERDASVARLKAEFGGGESGAFVSRMGVQEGQQEWQGDMEQVALNPLPGQADQQRRQRQRGQFTSSFGEWEPPELPEPPEEPERPKWPKRPQPQQREPQQGGADFQFGGYAPGAQGGPGWGREGGDIRTDWGNRIPPRTTPALSVLDRKVY